MSQATERSFRQLSETIGQIKERLRREDEEREQAWQRGEMEAQAEGYRQEKDREQQAKALAVERELQEKREQREQEMKTSAM